jgi:Fungal protein kinase
VAHRRITTITELREGLEFGDRHRFRNEDVHSDHPPSTMAGTTILGNKRKSSSSYTSDNVSGPKRLRSSSQKPNLSTSNVKPSLYTPGDDLWENRIFSCIVISPAGRVISDFQTVEELLEAMRDAIKAHQSLYEIGNILHRDISSNNIIITKPETAGGFKGMLIDLDLAKVKDSGPSGARHQTGTMQFMAVEVLRMADHTYRHDLESFFYVLLWMSARQSWHNGFAGERKPPKESLLRKWEIGSFKDIASAKIGHMTVNGMDDIMGEFPEALEVVKSLCLKIRKMLFPLDEDERMNFGTPAGDPDRLYRLIIGAYDDSIGNL